MHRWCIACLLSLMSLSLHADETALNETLVRIINQINAIQPLLDKAKTEVSPTDRIQLHIETFEGSDTKKHPGLRDDLLSIRNALIDYINHPVIAPRVIEPLAMDFIQ
jgi:hypothetical protein